MIKVKKLVKKYDSGEREFLALKGISFEVPTSQFLAIVGKSGAGKSTALYQLSLLDKPTSGSVIIDGENIELLDDKKAVVYRRNNFGFIFQDYAILPTLTALENVALPLLMQGGSEKEVYQKAKDSLEHVGLLEFVDRLPSQLSGGQQQRVSIARAIVHKPKILFADEPTANLDTESSEQVLEIFAKLNKKGLTIVMVTHEMEYALLADRIIELRDGEIIKDKILKKKIMK